MPSTEASPAATVILARDTAAGLQVLMLKRNSAHSFGGMWVFPGGKVDPEDAGEDELATARTAAAREAREEAGLSITADHFVTLAHWMPPPEAPRRFSTWFFVAEAPADCEVTIDGHEIHEHVWITPGAALDRHAEGEIELAPPTWISLASLAPFETVAAAVAHGAARTEPERYATHIVKDAEHTYAVWAGDPAYDSADLVIEGPRRRLRMGKGRWHFDGELWP
jgi:8-oxo-dGTP pyrophosphatase MutT (NUDIX family)